jgi:hypothetical protein
MNAKITPLLGILSSLKLISTTLIMFLIVVYHPRTTLSTASTADKEIKQHENSHVRTENSTNTRPSANSIFDRDILLYGKPSVHQLNISQLPGNERLWS